MFARVVTGEGPIAPDQIEAGIRVFREKTVPMYQELAWFRAAYMLLDRTAGKGGTVTLWETEENAKAVDAALAPLTAQVTQQLNVTQPLKTEIYEAAAEERGAAAPGAFARVVRGQVPPERMGERLRLFREEMVPHLRRAKGFDRIYFLVDRAQGKTLAISFWEIAGPPAGEDEARARELATRHYGTMPQMDLYEVAVRA